MLEAIQPMDIEKRSFAIITELLGDTRLDPENEPVIKRVIHTTADFDYVKNLVFRRMRYKGDRGAAKRLPHSNRYANGQSRDQ